MSSLVLRELGQVVGNEVLCRVGQESIILGLVRRDVSRSQITFDNVWPKHYFWQAVELTGYECNDLFLLINRYVYPLVNALARSIDKAFVTQIVKILKAVNQIAPYSVSGAHECEQWVQRYWQAQRTSTAGRCFLLSSECEAHVLRCRALKLSKSDSRMDASLSRKKHVFDLQDWWLLTTLEKYIVAFQQQAITVTSANLQPVSDRDSVMQTLQYKGLCIQVTCTSLSEKKYGIRVDWTGSITRFNLNHCCLITEKAFMA